MSDVNAIEKARQAERNATSMEFRAIIAAEKLADSVEGMRQDLTLLTIQMGQVIQQLGRQR